VHAALLLMEQKSSTARIAIAAKVAEGFGHMSCCASLTRRLCREPRGFGQPPVSHSWRHAYDLRNWDDREYRQVPVTEIEIEGRLSLTARTSRGSFKDATDYATRHGELQTDRPYLNGGTRPRHRADWRVFGRANHKQGRDGRRPFSHRLTERVVSNANQPVRGTG